jgi:hypothetical protein
MEIRRKSQLEQKEQKVHDAFEEGEMKLEPCLEALC